MKVTRLEGAGINVLTHTDDDDNVTGRELVMTVTVQVPMVGPGGQPIIGVVEVEQIILPLGRNPQNGRLACDDVALLLQGLEPPPDVQTAPAAALHRPLLDHLGRNGQSRP